MKQPQFYMLYIQTPPWMDSTFGKKRGAFTAYYPGARPRRCEIRYLQTGALTVDKNGHSQRFPEGSVVTLVQDAPYTLSSSDPEYFDFLQHFICGEEPKPISGEDVIRWRPRHNIAILPCCVTEPAVCRRISELMKKYLKHRSSSSPDRYLLNRFVFSEILAVMTMESIRQARRHHISEGDAGQRYCALARIYISDHLHEKIRVEDIARQVGISYNYLSQQFTSNTGLTLVEYINREKIRLVQELLITDHLSPEEAGAAIGVEDVKYLRRLFRKFTGMTITEYTKMHG